MSERSQFRAKVAILLLGMVGNACLAHVLNQIDVAHYALSAALSGGQFYMLFMRQVRSGVPDAE